MEVKKMFKVYENVLEWEIYGIEELTQENEPSELQGVLNPKYFEEVIKLKDAKNMIFSHLGTNGSVFNITRPY
jgi:hypothetical protein